MSRPERAFALAALAIAVASTWLSPAATQDTAHRLRVLAAASLTEAVEGLAKDYPGASVTTSFGASSELARQIRDGAPADVFVSASPEWVDFLREADRLDGAAVVIARNTLVAVAPKGSALAGTATSPAALLERLAPGDRVAIADAGVPAGDYARKALAHAGLLAAYEPRLVGQKDVRAVLHAVEQGELVAGFVYATDARVASVERLFDFDAASHPPIEYHAAALRGAASPAEAHRFVEHLRSPAAQTRLREAGFALP
ncbi:MAG TPA: molybdate ABC transporter substrate-binding protein [Myxococcota bacterium]|jgi:molybdate transport system substrate-binding protein|nr:molybdate ABC transporter substrate-binding protein [Myxococcota bacterium]